MVDKDSSTSSASSSSDSDSDSDSSRSSSANGGGDGGTNRDFTEFRRACEDQKSKDEAFWVGDTICQCKNGMIRYELFGKVDEFVEACRTGSRGTGAARKGVDARAVAKRSRLRRW